MHALEDMRIITYAFNITKSVGRVDASGKLTDVEREVTIDNPIPLSAWPLQGGLYQCLACSQEFPSWTEAKTHIMGGEEDANLFVVGQNDRPEPKGL